jgi:hypothetical protein
LAVNKEDVTAIATAIKAQVKPKIEALEARVAALEGGGGDKLLHSRIKLLEDENAALQRRLANRIPAKRRA